MSHPTNASSHSSLQLQSHTSRPRKPTDSWSFCIISRLILALILSYAAVIMVCLVAWFILDPQPPLFKLNSVSISNSTVSKSQEKKASYCLELSIKNPNKKNINMQLEDFRIFVFYNATAVWETCMNTVDLEKMSERTLTVKGDMVVNEGSRGSSMVNNTGVKMKGMIRLRAANLLTRRRIIEVSCINLGVDFIEARGKNCSVVLYYWG